MLVVPQIVSDIVGTVINVTAEKYARGRACLQEYLFEHFNNEGRNWFLHDVSVTLIDKTDAKKSYQTRTLLVTYPQNVGTSWS